MFPSTIGTHVKRIMLAGEKQHHSSPLSDKMIPDVGVDNSLSSSSSNVEEMTTKQIIKDDGDTSQQQEQSSALTSPPSLRSLSFLDESQVDFLDFDFEIPLRWYKRVWSFVLCIGGIFDILASAEPTLRSYAFCAADTNTGANAYANGADPTTRSNAATTVIGLGRLDIKGIERILLDTEINGHVKQLPWCCSIWITFLNRLNDYNVVISFFFALLWFKYSHAKAREEYYKARIQKDRIQLLYSDSEVAEADGTFSSSRKMNRDKKKKKLNPRYIFYRRILLRAILLPVGFYIILYHFIQGLINGKWLFRELLIAPVNDTVFLTVKDPNEYIKYEISKEHAKMSTIFSILQYLYQLYLATTIIVRTRLSEHFKNSAVPKLRRKLVGNAVRNPRKLMREITSLLKYIRWTKYIAPLVGKLNKLRGNLVSALRKSRQYSIAKRQKQLYEYLWKKKSPAEKEEDAVILIQRVWRTYQNHVNYCVDQTSTTDKRPASAMKIQLAFRRKALHVRYQLSRKRLELHRLEQERIRSPEKLNDDERKRLYELQDEFIHEAKHTINKRLLIRPNTKIAVAWNYLFILCIFVEISQNAFRPWLQLPKTKNRKNKDDNKVEYMSMREFVATSLIPIQVSETPECRSLFQRKSRIQNIFHRTQKQYGVEYHDDPNHKHNTNNTNDLPWMCTEPVARWRDSFRDIVALSLNPVPITDWSQCKVRKSDTLLGRLISSFRKNKNTNPPPWYCSQPYVSIHNCYRSIWNFIIDEIKIVIAFVCFLDFFVKFFTGEIDATTGELRSKPFFRRWIIPGLLFQLLVNPAIGSFSRVFFQITNSILVIGPVRVVRWYIAVVIPIAYASRFLIIKALHGAESDKRLVQYGMMLWEYSC